MRIAYGVDVQGEASRIIVRAERRGRRFAYARVDAVPARDAARGVPVAACMTARECVAQWIEAPFGARSKAMRVFPTVLDVDLPFPLDACAYAFLDAHKGSETSYRALAVASRLETMRRKIEALAALGMEPHALDQESLALWSQSLREAPPAAGADELRVVLYMADDRWCLVAGRGRRILHTHAPRPDQRDNMLRVLDAHVRPAERVRWCIAGPAAEKAAAGIERELLAARPGTWMVHNEPAAFLARGLATRQLVREPYACNLRAGALEHAGSQSRAARRSLLAAIAVLAAAVFLVAVNLGVRVDVAGRQAAMENTYRALTARVAGYDIGAAKGEHALRIVEEALRRRETAHASFLAAFEPSLAAFVLDVVRAAGKAGLKIESMSIDKSALSAKGTAPEWRSPEPLVALAGASGYKVTLQRSDVGADGRIPFELRTEASHE